jgi:cell division protein FtsX
VSILQALRYFFREAGINLLRGWKVSLLAVLTIAVSLFIGGAFLLVSGNLSASVERWRG